MMGNTIGRKIRELRKELKMTQTELAGSEMTKSMLSHIETGHSRPSMKNLEYIANKLNKPIAYFLQEECDDLSNKKEVNKSQIEKIVYALKNIDKLVKENNYEAAKAEAESLLKVNKLDSTERLYADIVYKLGYCNIKSGNIEEGKSLIEESYNIYVDNLLYEDAIRSCLELIRLEISRYNYKVCEKLLDKIYEVYNQYSGKDIFLEIEILGIQPAIHFALGNFQRVVEVCQKAISLSKENNIYYRLDDSYRMLAILYMLQGDFIRFDFNANEAKKYVELTGNKLNLAKIYHNYAKYENLKGNPLQALKYLRLLELNSGGKSFYYELEYGKAQYLLGNYEEAKGALLKINYNEKPVYQMDCIYMATSKIYMGLISYKLGEVEKAVDEIKEVIKEIEEYTTSEYEGFVAYALNDLAFAYSSLSEIYSLSEKYEEAYLMLKKSNEMSSLYKDKLSFCKAMNYS